MTGYDRGDSIKMTITVPTDTADYDKIIVKIIHKHLRSVLARYSLQDTTVTKATSTTITFTITDVQTASAPLGVYQHQVKMENADGSPRFQVLTEDSFYLKRALT